MQPYHIRESMLDPIERSLYRALNIVLCQRALLFTKINLSDLFAIAYNASGDLSQLIDQKVDFVVCDRDSMRPMGVILFEEDASVPKQEHPSEQIVQLCTQAGLPVVRLRRQPTYLMHQLTSIIEPLLTNQGASDDYSNGDRALEMNSSARALTTSNTSRRRRKQPAYPGYGALRTIANKLS